MKKSVTIVLGCIICVLLFQAFSLSNEPEFKNLKIFPKDISEHELDSVMHHFSESLGVKCNFCHVNTGPKEWDFASDAKPEKEVARKMMLLAIDINKKYFSEMEMDPEHIGSKDHVDSIEHHMDKQKMDSTGTADIRYMLMSVTCFTCHRGEPHPETKIPEHKEGPRPPEPNKNAGK